MVPLAPALLFFNEEMRSHVVEILRGGPDGTAGVRDALAALPEFMEEEIKRRLQSARREIEGEFPSNAAGNLALRAPWDLIKMFNETPAISFGP